jgi:hypothetical protein
MQSPHPRQCVMSTMFGSSTLMRKIAFREQAFAAAHLGQRMHFSG